MRRFSLVLLLFTTYTGLAWADVKPHGLFTDHMVLQQGMKVPVWGKADPGEEVTVSIQDKSAAAKADDAGKWMVQLDDLKAGGPFELKLRGKNTITLKDVLVGEVWICSGQSNMEMSLAGCKDAKDKDFMATTANDQIRLFQHKRVTATTPRAEVSTDNNWKEWKVCGPNTVPSFSGVAYYFGRKLQSGLKVPIGLIHTSWGGTPAEAWTPKEFLEKTPELGHYVTDYAKRVENFHKNAEQMKKDYEQRLKTWEENVAKAKAENKKAPNRPGFPGDPEKSPNSPSLLYNAMIHPLLPFAIKGATWYQGESNAGRAYEYRTLFPTMIQSWRTAWGYDFPFYFVQLAPWRAIKNQPTESDWAELREAQLITTQKLAGTGMAVITDTTDSATDQQDIHPKNKGPVGERLALAALQKTYGLHVVGLGPIYESMTVEGDKIILHFNSIGSGLICKGDKLTGFALAGRDKKFVWADAAIAGNTVMVSSPEVKEPLAVRFGWSDYPVVNLFNKEGLPATPFRSDDWPGVTGPKPR